MDEDAQMVRLGGASGVGFCRDGFHVSKEQNRIIL